MQRRTVLVDETPRNYLVFHPDGRPAPGSGLPLVVVLHGGATVADMILHYSRFNEVAARENFAVAYPYGVNRWWNDGRMIDGRGETEADDVAFIRALVADVSTNVRPLDRGRLYATGISNGGFMSLRLACEAADLFAAVAAVSATMPLELGARCRPAKPVAVLTINGTGDSLVPYVGGHARTAQALRGAIWSTDRTIAFWSRHNRCAEAPSVRVLPDKDPTDGSYVIEADYRGCAGAPVKLLRVEGGGHTWPGSVQAIPANLIGTTNRDIDATETIWSFFKSSPANDPLPAWTTGAPRALHPVSTSAAGSR
jgi:polyhydroxybutyrate depolymerase